jgi:hypothetical protein
MRKFTVSLDEGVFAILKKKSEINCFHAILEAFTVEETFTITSFDSTSERFYCFCSASIESAFAATEFSASLMHGRLRMCKFSCSFEAVCIPSKHADLSHSTNGSVVSEGAHN